MIRAALLMLCCVAPVAAQDAAPEKSPRPAPSPAELVGPTQAPQNDVASSDADAPPGQAAVRSDDTPGLYAQLVMDDAEYAACLADLDSMDVTYSETDPLTQPGDMDCGIQRPLIVSEIAPGVVITPPATLRCATVRAAARWTRDFVLPAADRLGDRGALTAIENGSGYVCRRRNGAPDGKLSEHAFGNALDVMGFRFADGPPIAVEPREADGTLAEAFQDAARASACLDFATVLGPGSNAAHDDHLHLDVIARSSGYRLCEQGGGTAD